MSETYIIYVVMVAINDMYIIYGGHQLHVHHLWWPSMACTSFMVAINGMCIIYGDQVIMHGPCTNYGGN